MLWQGAKWRILKNFNVQNEECHNYVQKLASIFLAITYVGHKFPHNLLASNQPKNTKKKGWFFTSCIMIYFF